ncbi:MAG: JAB domain-containing protein, partial [Bacteroidales bacterium]
CIVLIHNHPSGNLFPSKSDDLITTKIKEGLSLFDIKVLDHIILTERNKYFSYTDEGKIQ